MRTQPVSQHSRFRRGVVAAVGVVVAGGLIAFGGAAAASPQPSASQLQQRINKLMSKADAVSQQYDQTLSQLRAAKARLTVVNKQLAKNQGRFEALRMEVTQLAAAAYEQGDMNSASAMVTSNNPQTVLDRASLVDHLSSDRRAAMSAFITAAQALRSSQQMAQRTKTAISQLKAGKAAQLHRLKQLVAKNQSKLNQLTAPTGGLSGPITYTGPATGGARKAVSFALSQIGAPYVWGGTGPYSAGYDCSGLVMVAWQQAGVQIPRTTYDMAAQLVHIPTSSIQPGDLLLYDGDGHVAMYVGNGQIVDAPQSGENVEELPMSTSWYASNFDGAVRP